MKAFRVNTGSTVAPFGDAVGRTVIGAGTLAEAQDAALEAEGFELVERPPTDEPYLIFSDRTWFTAGLLRQVRGMDQGRVHLTDPQWWAWTGALQDTPQAGLYELGVRTGPPGFADMTPVTLDVTFNELELDALHARVAHAHRTPVMAGVAMAHQVDHWMHIVRINQLVLAERLETAREEWAAASGLARFFKGLGIVLRACSVKPAAIAASLTEVGRDCEIHPTAVVELSVLGDGVKVGPHAVVRGSILGPGAKVDAFANVNASVLGAGARAGRYAFLNLCTLYPRAMVSKGDGFQASVFGEDSFVAWGATILDLSFGQGIKVETDGPGSQRVQSGAHFLGAALGHRAVIGNKVRVRYGVAIPNDGMVLDAGDDLLRQWGEGPTGEPVVVSGGKATRPER